MDLEDRIAVVFDNTAIAWCVAIAIGTVLILFKLYRRK